MQTTNDPLPAAAPELTEVLAPASAWRAITAGHAELQLHGETHGPHAQLRFDYDFHDAGGFVVARREWQRPLPSAYQVRFRLRAHGAINDLELKFSDALGRHVRRVVLKRATRAPRWRSITIDSEDIVFAWGEAGDGVLHTLGIIEFAVVAADGGRGKVWIEDLQIIAIAPARLDAQTSSGSVAVSSDAIRWQAQPRDTAPWLQLDASREQRYGGVVIDWQDRAPARGFRLRSSRDGQRWRTIHSVHSADGRRSAIALPNLHLRHLRLECHEPVRGAQLQLQAPAFSSSPEAFWQQLAAREPRGHYPRWLYREQCLWTLVGCNRGAPQSLLDEDGRVECGLGGAMLEPLLRIGERLYSWADVRITRSLRAGWMPAPCVHWHGEDWQLQISAEATHWGALRLHYRLLNDRATPLDAELLLLLRPLQVSPPWQKFGELGGVRPLYRLRFDGSTVEVDAGASVRVLDRSTRFGAQPFAHGSLVALLAEDRWPAAQRVQDRSGRASAVLGCRLHAAAHGQDGVHVAAAAQRDQLATAAEPGFDWAAVFPTRWWSAANDGAEAIDTAFTAGAHILLTRDGAALQPGARRYTRCWIRDATIMAGALLRLNRIREVREFIVWYAPFVREDGFVPCCVDRSGVDPLVEHDSHGQWLALIADYFHYSCDLALVESLWPQIERTVACIEKLLEPSGLLPISASHEGYLAQPVHAYWDDFWALRGVRDAIDLARQCKRGAQQQAWCALEQRIARGLFASIEATRAARHLDFIPGSLEWADFDPSATASAITLLNLPPELDRAAVERTFRRYLELWQARQRGDDGSRNHSPYEIRIIGALVRLGWRDEALAVLRGFLADRRPRGWSQWPEIAWHDAQAPAHLGDLPHTWIAAEYVLVLRSLFAFESHPLQAQVLAAGVAAEWLDADGVRVSAMPTRHGPLSYQLRREADGSLWFRLEPGIATPILLKPPLSAAPRAVHADSDDVAVEIVDDGIRIAPITRPLTLRIHPSGRVADEPDEPASPAAA